jgi:hypothetical protein
MSVASILANVLLVCRAVVASSIDCVFKHEPRSGSATCCVYQQGIAAVNTHVDLIMLEAPWRILCAIQLGGHLGWVILQTTSSLNSSD